MAGECVSGCALGLGVDVAGLCPISPYPGPSLTLCRPIPGTVADSPPGPDLAATGCGSQR
jgi:hypothetical protein